MINRWKLPWKSTKPPVDINKKMSWFDFPWGDSPWGQYVKSLPLDNLPIGKNTFENIPHYLAAYSGMEALKKIEQLEKRVAELEKLKQ